MEIQPVFAEDSPYWDLEFNEFYVRDVNGKEIAIYQDTTLYQWNVWGLDNVGKIDSYGDRYFYLKDHLGSIRVVLDSRYNVVSALDYDMWGHILENRTYTSGDSRYKFVSTELDQESGYTNFTMRKYDSKIGRFFVQEPLISSSFGWSSYVYSANNPLRIIDPSGTEWYYVYNEDGTEGKWTYFANTASRYMWAGKYDEIGNKTYEKVEGYKEILFFQGSSLTWYMESGEEESWEAVSGVLDEEGKTQPDLQNVKDKGPIPEGWYTISPEDTKASWLDSNPLALPMWLKNFISLGFAYTPIKPVGTTETHGRGGFFIHGGLYPGSIGCIDLTSPNNESFHMKFLENERTIPLQITYPQKK